MDMIMKRALFIIAAAVYLMSAAVAQTGEPKLVLPRTEFDFGRIDPKGGTVSHAFTVRNEGTAPLVILKTYTSCSCTEAKYPRKPIMPGDSAVIKVSYDPKTQMGTVFRAIQVYSNDPAKRTIVTIKGEVK